jgi:hypothetical protein
METGLGLLVERIEHGTRCMCGANEAFFGVIGLRANP